MMGNHDTILLGQGIQERHTGLVKPIVFFHIQPRNTEYVVYLVRGVGDMTPQGAPHKTVPLILFTGVVQERDVMKFLKIPLILNRNLELIIMLVWPHITIQIQIQELVFHILEETELEIL
jgi:hypothetical protein